MYLYPRASLYYYSSRNKATSTGSRHYFIISEKTPLVLEFPMLPQGYDLPPLRNYGPCWLRPGSLPSASALICSVAYRSGGLRSSTDARNHRRSRKRGRGARAPPWGPSLLSGEPPSKPALQNMPADLWWWGDSTKSFTGRWSKQVTPRFWIRKQIILINRSLNKSIISQSSSPSSKTSPQWNDKLNDVGVF